MHLATLGYSLTTTRNANDASTKQTDTRGALPGRVSSQGRLTWCSCVHDGEHVYCYGCCIEDRQCPQAIGNGVLLRAKETKQELSTQAAQDMVTGGFFHPRATHELCNPYPCTKAISRCRAEASILQDRAKHPGADVRVTTVKNCPGRCALATHGFRTWSS